MQKDIPLHDIKPLVEVPDNSFIYLLSVGALLAVVLLFILLWVYKAYKKSKILSRRKMILEKLRTIDMSKTKEAAYHISEYGRFLAKREEEKEIFEKLQNLLEQYKYKKEVSSFDEESLKTYQDFLEALDVS